LSDFLEIAPGTICTNYRRKKDADGKEIFTIVKEQIEWGGEMITQDKLQYENEWECDHEATSAWTGDEGIMGAIECTDRSLLGSSS